MSEFGVNGYSGDIIGYFFENENVQRGTTVPITLTLTVNNAPVDVAGYEMLLSFDEELASADADTPFLEVDIPISGVATDGTFSGDVTDEQTFSLPEGSVYISLKYIDASGKTFIKDMVKYAVVSCVNPKRA